MNPRLHADLQGRRFNRLVAVEYVRCPYRGRGWWWRCVCDCGQTTHSPSNDLIRGRRKSCGCTSHVKKPCHRDRVLQYFQKNGGSRASVARALGLTKNIVVGILYRKTVRRRFVYVNPPMSFEDDSRAVRPDRGWIGLPPATEVGRSATPLIEAIRGRWSPHRGTTSER